MTRSHLSTKQLEIIDIITKGNGVDGDGSFVPADLDELLTRLSYKPTKQSIQFSIRALIARKLIYRGERINRRGRARVTIWPTEEARLISGTPTATVGLIESGFAASPVELKPVSVGLNPLSEDLPSLEVVETLPLTDVLGEIENT